MPNLKQNYLYNLTFQIISIALPFITAPYTSRVLGAEGIGQFSFSTSLITYFQLLSILGLSMYGQREVAYHQDNIEQRSRIFFNVQIFKAILFLIVMLLYIIFVHLCMNDDTIYYIQGLTLFATFFDISWFFQGLEDFKKIIIRNVLVRLLGVICIFTFIHTKNDLLLYVFLMIFINVIGNLSLWIYLPSYIKKPINIRPFENFRVIIELFLPLIAIQVYQVLDKTMIGFMTSSPSENGYYDRATQLTSLSLAIITSLGTVLIPKMSRMYAEKRSSEFEFIAQKAFQYVIYSSTFICAILIGVSTYFVLFFFGEEFSKTALLLKYYSLIIIIIPLSNIAGSAILTPTKQHNKGTIAVIIGAIVNFTLNCFLIPRYLSLGAAVSTIVAECLVTIVHLYFIRDYLPLKPVIFYFIQHSIVGLAVSIVMICFGIFLYGTLAANSLFTCIILVLIGSFIYYLTVRYILKDKLCDPYIISAYNKVLDICKIR